MLHTGDAADRVRVQAWEIAQISPNNSAHATVDTTLCCPDSISDRVQLQQQTGTRHAARVLHGSGAAARSMPALHTQWHTSSNPWTHCDRRRLSLVASLLHPVSRSLVWCRPLAAAVSNLLRQPCCTLLLQQHAKDKGQLMSEHFTAPYDFRLVQPQVFTFLALQLCVQRDCPHTVREATRSLNALLGLYLDEVHFESLGQQVLPPPLLDRSRQLLAAGVMQVCTLQCMTRSQLMDNLWSAVTDILWTDVGAHLGSIARSDHVLRPSR